MGGSGRDVPGGWLTYMSGTWSQLLGAWTAPGTTLTVTALPPAIVLASYPVTPDAQKCSQRVSDYRSGCWGWITRGGGLEGVGVWRGALGSSRKKTSM